MVKPDEFSNRPCGRGPGGRSGRCTLCVCFLGDPSFIQMRTLRSKLLLGNYKKIIPAKDPNRKGFGIQKWQLNVVTF